MRQDTDKTESFRRCMQDAAGKYQEYALMHNVYIREVLPEGWHTAGGFDDPHNGSFQVYAEGSLAATFSPTKNPVIYSDKPENVVFIGKILERFAGRVKQIVAVDSAVEKARKEKGDTPT